MIVRVLLGLAGGYVFIMAFMYVFQRQLEYFPGAPLPAAPRDSGLPEMQSVVVTTADGLKLAAWFAPPREKDGRIIVMFHGNAGNVADRAVKARHFMERGYGVYMCEYRGYGGNSGGPSEEGFYLDARAALRWLGEQGYSPGTYVLYGESIGTGVAVQMARETQPKILILEAPFSSAVDVAKAAYPWLPVDLLMKDKFDSISKINAVKSSLLIIHGDEDATIPIGFARRLFDAANHPKEFITINGGGHSDLYEHHAGHIVTDWLEKQA
jgi:fermentation-respiration switch protein FrsA (DUF1100 family)